LRFSARLSAQTFFIPILIGVNHQAKHIAWKIHSVSSQKNRINFSGGNAVDSLILLKDTSLSGEAWSRPENSEHAAYDNETIALIIRRVLDLPKNGIGHLAGISELIRDLKNSNEFGNTATEWESALRSCKAELEMSKTESQDLILTGKTASYQLRMLLTKSDQTLPRESKLQIKLLRARVILYHLGRRQPIPERLARWFVQIIAGNSKQANDLMAKLSYNREALRALRSSYAPESDQAEFLTSVITAIDAPIISPPTVSPQQVVPIVSTIHAHHTEDGVAGNDADIEDKSNPQIRDKDDANVDIVGQFLQQTEYARPRDFAGISNTWDYLQPSELENAVGTFTKDLEGPFAQESLVSLLAISTRTRPQAYRSIPITESTEHSMWIDLESGHICWKLEAVIDRKRWRKIRSEPKGRPPVRIPLPVEVSSRLHALFSTNPLAKNLGDFFGGNLSKLEGLSKKYLKKVSLNSHRLTLGRLASSFARYLVYTSQDEAYASLLGIDFRIGTPSNLNYCSFRANRVNSILREAYSRLGLSGKIGVPVTADVGSRFLGAMLKVDAILKDSLEEAFAVYGSVKHKHDAASIAEAHNVISNAVLRAACVVTGHRESDNHSFGHHTIDIKAGLALISDKLVSPYHQARLVPIPAVIAEWLKFYFRWLEHVQYRYLSLDKRVSKHIDSILKSQDRRANGPLFFSISSEGNIRGLKNTDIAEHFKRKGLEANSGRHWAENILRESGLDSAVIMAWAGHSAIGQEAYGVRSALDPMTIMYAVRHSLNTHLDLLCLPQPPSLVPRKANVKFAHAHDFTLGGFGLKPELIVGNLLSYEVCPFDENSLVRSRHFVEICRKWLSAASEKSVGSLAISLMLNDGIANREELIGVVKNILWGKIHKDNDTYFVDSDTVGLGIRRTWLSSASAILSTQVDKPKCDEAELISLIRNSASTLLNACELKKSVCSLEQILEMAQGFYSLRLPGILRGWMFGHVHARTSRPETVARHRSGLVEHPRIEEGTRSNKSRQYSSDDFITKLILREADTTEYRGREKTRLCVLRDALLEYENIVSGAGALEIKLRYAIYLTGAVDSPKTVQRYYYPLRQFIETCCLSIDGLDDSAEIEWKAQVNDFRNTCVAVSENGQSPELSALNHFLRCFSIDLITLQRSDPAAAARRYTEFPSLDEVRRAIDEMPTISSLPPPRTTQAVIAFKTMSARYLRWFEISRLRICDVAGLDNATLVISHEAVGTHKSNNADRTHCGIDSELSDELTSLAAIRSQQFKLDSESFLFCNPNNNRSVSQSDELRRLITDALWSATGSEFISPHCSRRLAPIIMCDEFFSPESRKLKSPLALRQFLFVLAGNIGHGDPLTTVSNYLCRFDEWRRQWVDHLLLESKIEASTIFSASLLGIPADTLRARARRNSRLVDNAILDDFDFESHPSFVSRTRCLEDYLVKATTRLPVDPTSSKSNEAVACAVYTSALLQGYDADLAAFISQICHSSKMQIDRGLALLSAGLGKAWNVNVSVSPTELLKNDLFMETSCLLSDCHLTTATALAISRAIAQPNDAWILTSLEDAAVISKLIFRIANQVVTCLVSRPKNKVDGYRAFAIFPTDKYSHRQLSSRLFPRDCILRVQFIPLGTKEAGFPATTPITTFFISAILISRCALTLGESDE
jgi:hypothetical protein